MELEDYIYAIKNQVKTCFLIRCDDILFVNFDDYNKLVDIINAAIQKIEDNTNGY